GDARWEVCDALSRAGFERDIAAGIRGERGRDSFYAARGAGSFSRSSVRKRWRSGRSADREDRRDVLPDVHGLQQEGCTALPGDFARFGALGAERRDFAGVPGELEQGVDEIRRNSDDEDSRRVLDVLAGGSGRQNGSDGTFAIEGFDSLD